MIVSADGGGYDLGYPATVELADGSLLTVWYEFQKAAGKAVLRQAKWKIGNESTEYGVSSMGGVSGRRRAAEGRGVAPPRPPASLCSQPPAANR